MRVLNDGGFPSWNLRGSIASLDPTKPALIHGEVSVSERCAVFSRPPRSSGREPCFSSLECRPSGRRLSRPSASSGFPGEKWVSARGSIASAAPLRLLGAPGLGNTAESLQRRGKGEGGEGGAAREPELQGVERSRGWP